MPLVFAFLAAVIVFIITAAKKKEAEQKAAQAQAKISQKQAQNAAPAEELKRQLQNNAGRGRLERESLKKPAPNKPEKPVAAHTDADCGGGSIHDGYHEGVTQFDNGRPAAVAGKLGHRLADEDERIEKEQIAAENAKRAMARISKLPPLAQGMVYSEILGKPKSA